MSLYFSRLTLNRFAPTRALSALIDPDNHDARADAGHRLIWSLFGDALDRPRDFLWRADGRGRFYTLSARPPLANDLFAPPETKEFAPQLAPGDKLTFTLRANATRSRRIGPRKSQRVDIVMDLLHPLNPTERAEKRDTLAQTAAADWVAHQGAAHGFVTDTLTVEGYHTLQPGQGGRKSMTLGVLDLSGTLTVTDPTLFLPALADGFGRAKAWGCGLMLIRRAR